MKAIHFILYVSNQERSSKFYEKIFELQPRLNVPGMTEFELSNGTILGLMPESGINKLLEDKIKSPSQASGIPRSELYLVVDEPERFHLRALELGAKELSPFQKRDWGDSVAYSSDLDGHILAFASNDV